MGTIFDQIPDSSPSASEAIARAIVKQSKNIKENMQKDYKKAFELLWGTEDNRRSVKEVQAIVDAWGEYASAIFLASAKTQQFIASVDDEYEPLIPPYPLSYNEDGTIKVG